MAIFRSPLIGAIGLFIVGWVAVGSSQQPPAPAPPPPQSPPKQPEAPLVNDDRKSHEMPEVNMSGVDMASQRMMVEMPVLTNVVGRVQPVLTRSYDNLRSGANTKETILTPASVAGKGMKLKFAVTVNGDARGFEAQPLFVPSVTTLDGVTHDVMLLGTMANITAAFDASDGTPIWMRRLAPPVVGSNKIDYWNINDHWGILSTGVVVDNVLYVVAWTSPDGTPTSSKHLLYALNLRDGTDAKPPLLLPGSGQQRQRKQRASLTYTDVKGRKTIYVPWGTVQETADGAHGFITAVDLDKWLVRAELNLTRTGKGGGVWQAGQGLLTDAEGYLFAMTSNGTYDGVNDFSESFIKVSDDGAQLRVVDHYVAYKDAERAPAYIDNDLGSGAPSLIPELQIVFGAGKDGILYVLPWRAMKKPTVEPIWYTFYPGPGVAVEPPPDKMFFNRTHHAHSSSVVWKTANTWRVFCWGENSNLRAWTASAKGFTYLGTGEEVASVQSPVPPGGMPGGFMSLSSNGQTNGIVWAVVPLGDANRTVTQGYLAAYDATTLGKYTDGQGAIKLLWRSDNFAFSKFLPPVVTGGTVYVATYDGQVLAFGQ